MSTNRTWAVPRGLQTLFHAGSLVGVTDGQLLERFTLRDGEASETAFAALVERHGPLVWRTCRAVVRDEHEAADAFQATFLVLVRKAGSLWVRDSIAPWLHRVALRAANQARRELRRREEAERRAAAIAAAWTEGEMPDDLADVIHQEIDRLPERHRIVVVLCDIEERPLEEAARHLGCPVGTVKSRLARARERLRRSLSRRGVLPAAMSGDSLAMTESPSKALIASTIRGSVLFASDPIKAAGAVSKTAIILAEGVLRAMIRAKLQGVILVASAAVGLLVPAWLAFARQAVVERPKAEAPADPRVADRATSLEGNWTVRAYPSGRALALIKIEGPRRQPRATLLSIGNPDGFRLAESGVDRLRIDESTVRFTIRQQSGRPVNNGTFDVIASLPKGEPNPRVLLGSMMQPSQMERLFVFPATVERTDRTELDPKEAPGPGNEDLQRLRQTKDLAKRREILEGMLEKYNDTPMAPVAAWVLAIEQAESRAPEGEVRALIDRTARSGARHGREMEIGAINLVVRNLVGMEGREDLVLEYARKAAAMLQPTDPIALQVSTLKNLESAWRKSTRIDESKVKTEVEALEERIARLRHAGGGPDRADESRPVTKKDRIPWARNFAAARQQARAEGKLIMVDFYTQTCGWCKRLDSDVFPRPEVADAMRPFVPVKVDAEDGEGHPLSEQYQAHIRGYPAILFLDPAIEDTKDARIVGKIPGFMPAASFVEQLNTIARLPRDVGRLIEKARPDDGDVMRQLATALAMQGRVKEAVALIDRAWGPGADPDFDRWAAVYNTLGDEDTLHLKLGEAAEWYHKAARVAKRPIDVYNAHLGASFVAALRRNGDQAARELEAAAKVDGIPSNERDFAREMLGILVKPLDGSAGVPEAAAALKRLESKSSSKPSGAAR